MQRAQGGQWLPQELQARRENLRKARVSIEHQTERLTDAYLAGVVPLEEYKRRRHELEQRLEAIAAQMRQLEASATKHVELAGIAQSMEEFCQRVSSGLEQASFEQKRQLIELLIDRVVVTNEEVEIRYVIPTSTSSQQTRFCHLRSNYFESKRQKIIADHIFEASASVECRSALVPQRQCALRSSRWGSALPLSAQPLSAQLASHRATRQARAHRAQVLPRVGSTGPDGASRG